MKQLIGFEVSLMADDSQRFADDGQRSIAHDAETSPKTSILRKMFSYSGLQVVTFVGVMIGLPIDYYVNQPTCGSDEITGYVLPIVRHKILDRPDATIGLADIVVVSKTPIGHDDTCSAHLVIDGRQNGQTIEYSWGGGRSRIGRVHVRLLP